MATEYTINFTDPANGSFIIQPYTTNGPATPTSSIPFDSNAVAANTSVVLLGKGKFEYGEQIQESIVHMLEHFSASTAPVYPVQGQLWFQNDMQQLRISSSSTTYQVTGVTVGAGGTWTLAGGDYTSTFQPNTVIVITDNPAAGTYTVNSSAYISSDTIVTVNEVIPSFAASTGNAACWLTVLQGDRDVDLRGFNLINVGSPVSGNDAVTLNYADATYLNVSGGTLGGVLTMLDDIDMSSTNKIVNLAAPTVAGDATNKQYVDDLVSSAIGGLSGTFVNVSGDTMFGPLVMLANVDMSSNAIVNLSTPVGSGDATPKQYVDNLVSSSIGALSSVYVNLSGSTMSGILNMGSNRITGVASPTAPSDAANRGYVDVAVNAVGVISGSIDTLTNVLTLTQTSGVDVAITNIAPGNHIHLTSSIFHLISEAPDDSFIRTQSIERSTNPTSLYPNSIPFNDTVDIIDTALHSLMKPRLPREIQIGDGATVTFTLNKMSYIVGSNRLAVFVDGVKSYASERGTSQIELTLPTPNIGSTTGLIDGSYDFDIAVDGGLPTTVSVVVSQPTNSITGVSSIAGRFTVSGDAVAQFPRGTPFDVIGNTGFADGAYTIVAAVLNGGDTDLFVAETILPTATATGIVRKPYSVFDLTSEISSLLTSFAVPATVLFDGGSLWFFSNTVGNGSDVVITPGTLFAVGGLEDTYTLNITNTSILSDLGYEESGTMFTQSTSITFNTAPSFGATIEFLNLQ